MDSYLKGLNNEQLEAVRHEAGPCMVLAGPGTGKTTVITSRIINLIRKKIVSPENILVATFSKAAANEMKERFFRLFPSQSAREVSFGTFHSVFFKLLRQYRGYKLEDLLDENQKFNMIRNIAKRLGVDFSEDEEQIKSIISDMEYIVSTMSDISDYIPDFCDIRQLKGIMDEYSQFKQQSGKFDYNDILFDCLCLLRDNPGILREVRNRFRYILVDEFQDINILQYETIRLISKPYDNIFVVGDDDQSVYGFRGAAPDILLSFEKLYPECIKIYLKSNYRTTSNILNSAMTVINNNKKRYPKELKSVNEQGSLPITYEAEDFEEESRAIAKRIEQMTRGGRDYSDFAVIYRTNLQSRAVIDAFMDMGIPFMTLDGTASIYNHWVFRDIISYLKLGTGLGSSRDIMRIINRPKRYISKDTMAKAEKAGGDFLQSIMNQSNLNRMQINSLMELRTDLKRLGVMDPHNAVKYIRNVIGYDEYIKEYAAAKGISVKGLMETVAEIESSTATCSSILLYMQHVEEVVEKLAEKQFTGLRGNNVKLLTMHKAKGLEFDTVFICGSVEGLAPYMRDGSNNEDFEEERRLFYVAMTRAKSELYISIPKRRYGKAVKASRFVEELRRGIDYGSQVHEGRRVYHKIYYNGIIKGVIDSKEGTRIRVDFDGCIKELNLKTCFDNDIIRLL